MEEIWSVLMVIGLFAWVASKSAKKKNAGKPLGPRQLNAAVQAGPRPDEEDEDRAPTAPVQAQAIPRREETMLPEPEPAKPAMAGPGKAERAPLAPRLAPTPHDHSGMFDGSMMADADSPEGRDPHDHGFEEEVSVPSMTSEEEINRQLGAQEAPAQAAPVLRLTPESIREAFILQEVLKRRR